MTREAPNQIYTTLDAYQAGYLILKGHTPKLINQNNKVVFTFPVTENLYKNLSDYNNGDLVEALRLATTIKELKGRIFSLKTHPYETMI